MCFKNRDINDNDVVPVYGNVRDEARPEFDRGPVSPNLAYEKMVLVLTRRPGTERELQQLLAEQHDPASPSYHHWLTPAEFGRRFGIDDEDLATVKSWLTRQGFHIDEVANGRGEIIFSGRASQVERAFKTPIHNFEVNGKMYHANVADPEIPRGLSQVVQGVLSLHNFPRRAMNHGFAKVQSDYTTSAGDHFLSPGDFAKIYNVNPVYTAGYDGTGQTIAVVGRTDISLGDVQYFRSYFALPAKDPIFIHNGTSPGNLGGSEEGEADLDVEWAGAIAKNATVKFVVTSSTSTTDGVDLSAQYIINNNVAPVMTTSFGQCESKMGTTENNFFNNLWSQAAAQGITSFVSSGDSGASGCDAGKATTGTGKAVSGLSSTPYNVAVGGTQFNDTAANWATSNSTGGVSALGYIPEKAWNESASVSGGSGLWSTGGGVSNIYAKPSWQNAPGVPADGKRDVPDVSFTAAGYVGYIVVQGHTSTASGLTATGGTSASSPAWASVMSLVVQKAGAGQGNANTRFYTLARGSNASAIFHDITSGSNSVPGVTGFSCGVGYDAATGLGSVDVNGLITNWTTTPTYSISGSAGVSGATITAGSSSATSDSSSNYSMSGFAAGNYTVTPSKSGCTFTPASQSVTISSSNVTANFTATCGSIDTQLTSGVPVTGQSVALNGWKYYYITVPAGATNLTFTTTAATADIDIYTQSGAKPTSSSWICRPWSGSGNETCSATNPAAGTWWLGVNGYEAGSFTVTGTVTTSVPPIFSSGLDSSSGWSTAQVSGTTGAWSFVTSGTFPSTTPHGGTGFAKFNSYDATSGHQTRLYTTTGFAIPSSATTVALKFWMYHDSGYSTSADKVQVQVSTGSTWTSVGTAVNRYDGSTGWKQHTIDLTAYKGSTVQLGFLGMSAYGNNIFLDDVTVTTP